METKHEKRHKILVVDDNSENIRIIGSILRQNGYQVGYATGGQQALDIMEAKDEEYDLVLLDVNMPEINGFEVCRKIRKNNRLRELPVIFLTANAEPDQIIEGFSSGGQDYVTKPFHAGELLSRISTHLELREKREQLKQMNTLLEEKVRERTKQLEDANIKLEAANCELEKLDEAKAGFLHLISHEINTPLNGILGFASILREQLVETKYFSYIEYLSASARRLGDFAKSGLIITEMRTSPERYKKEFVDIGRIMEYVIKEHETFNENLNVGVVFNNKAVNLLVSGNRELITTSITHLLRNAVQNSPQGQLVTVNLYNETDKLCISFEDNGPGFSEIALHNLFKPFSTVEEHLNNNKGLGLMLVKMIADFHQASISVANEQNKGARVLLVFNQAD